MNIPPLRRLLRLTALLLIAKGVHADITGHPAVQAFIQNLAARHHFEAAALEQMFRQVDLKPKVLDSMARPAEAKPWREYRKLFLTESRIQTGVNFWNSHKAALEQAHVRYGVAPEMIVAILGVETTYGERTGNYRVIDALATLAFEYPRRADFFRKELEDFLLLCREESMDPLVPKGSYAGAMGLPQFMPSSYRRYAADLEHDGKRDIWTNPADAIASVANYFAANGWQRGAGVAYPAQTDQAPPLQWLSKSFSPKYGLADLRRQGITPVGTILPESTRVNLLMLDGETGPEYWLTLHNFLVITRYNHSPLYAMAAYQLGREILARRGAS